MNATASQPLPRDYSGDFVFDGTRPTRDGMVTFHPGHGDSVNYVFDGKTVTPPARRPDAAADAQGGIDAETITLALLDVRERTDGDPEAYEAAVARLADVVARPNGGRGTP